MKNRLSHSPRRGVLAFTLIELLVTMTLLTVIVLGLLVVFNQTQRAFRNGMGQTDILEGARGAVDMMVREIEQLTPSEGPLILSASRGVPPTYTYNFWTSFDPNFALPRFAPLVQLLAPANPPVPVEYRTNVIKQFFLLTKYNQDWNAVLYRVQPDVTGSAVGSLYRYSTVWPRYLPLRVGSYLLGNTTSITPVLDPWATWSANRIADGIIDLRVSLFDTNGAAMLTSFNSTSLTTTFYPSRPSVLNATAPPYVACDFAFWSNSVPAYIELEMGILEPKTLQHYRAMDPTTVAARNYLSNHVGEVYLFRQRIPIRNVDFTAYQ